MDTPHVTRLKVLRAKFQDYSIGRAKHMRQIVTALIRLESRLKRRK